ncbi:MAG: RNA polymerase sigma factor [Acidobacteriota bacterium]
MQAELARTMQRTDDIEEQVHQARHGNVDAFEAIYRRTHRRVYAICLRMAGDPSRAEEMVQETYLKAWSRLETYRAGTRFEAWLGRIAVNATLSEARSRGRRSRREMPVADPDRWDPPFGGAGPADGIDLERAIASLPPGARRIYVLHDVEGFRHREIAEELGLSSGTTKAQLHRARRLLREALTP